MSQFFASGGQSIGASASASVLPISPTGLISLECKGLSWIFSNSLAIKQSRGPSDSPQGLCVTFWAMFFELFCIIWNPHQVEELTCMCSQALDLRLCVLVTQSCPTLCELLSCSCQGALSMEFSRQEYWSGLPFPSPGDFLSPGIKPGALELQVDALLSQLLWKHQTSDWLETKGWLCWLLINSPAMNQKNVHKLIVNPITPFPHLIFKTLKKKNFPTAIWEFSDFESWLHGLLAWCPVISTAFCSTATHISKWAQELFSSIYCCLAVKSCLTFLWPSGL